MVLYCDDLSSSSFLFLSWLSSGRLNTIEVELVVYLFQELSCYLIHGRRFDEEKVVQQMACFCGQGAVLQAGSRVWCEE
jgi:hypothetical protein